MRRTIIRKETLTSLQSEEFDVLIIGGGASGLGCALDAQLRGLKTALIDAGDFASATSSLSTKLIHGGVRYLEKAVMQLDFQQYKLVKEALNERSRMLANAPFMAKAVGILLPLYGWWNALYYTVGVKVYDFLAPDKIVPPSNYLNAKETLKVFPSLNPKGLTGSIVYHDGQFDDSLYAIAIAQTAVRQGAKLCNYVSCEAFIKDSDGKICAVTAVDRLGNESFEIRAKAFVNCAGVFSDKLRLLAREEAKPRLRPSKGVHLLFDKNAINMKYGMLNPKTQDNRALFILPWNNAILVGTTDTEVSDPYQKPRITNEDIEYVLHEINPFLQKPLSKADIKGVFAGYRPLVMASGKSKTEALIRNHEVETWHNERLVNLLGGKWTTYRAMAAEAIDAICAMLNINAKCETENYRLIGYAHSPTLTNENSNAISMQQCASAHCQTNNKNVASTDFDISTDKGLKPLVQSFERCPNETSDFTNEIPQDILERLACLGIEQASIILDLKQNGITRLHPNYPFTTAEALYWIKYGFAENLADLLARRMRLELLELQAAKSAAVITAEVLQAAFAYTDEVKKQKLDEFYTHLETNYFE